jgi:hypothetical protein
MDDSMFNTHSYNAFGWMIPTIPFIPSSKWKTKIDSKFIGWMHNKWMDDISSFALQINFSFKIVVHQNPISQLEK